MKTYGYWKNIYSKNFQIAEKKLQSDTKKAFMKKINKKFGLSNEILQKLNFDKNKNLFNLISTRVYKATSPLINLTS